MRTSNEKFEAGVVFAKNGNSIERLLNAIDKHIRERGLEIVTYNDEHSWCFCIDEWKAPDLRKLPTEPGWWVGTDTSVIQVRRNTSDGPLRGKLYFNDYDENYHGFGLEKLPDNVDWTLVSKIED